MTRLPIKSTGKHSRHPQLVRRFWALAGLILTVGFLTACGKDDSDRLGSKHEPNIHQKHQALSSAPDTNCIQRFFGGAEYWFCDNDRDWAEARANCQTAGLDLVRIDSSDENDFVRSHVGSDTWIGANDQASEGTWLWSIGGEQFWQGEENGSSVSGLFESWGSGQPNDLGGEDCAQIEPDGDWRDDDCNDGEEYVCEQIEDNCPNDPLKSEPGLCGCGTPDTDSDSDGFADCDDACPNDPNKLAPGDCGCADAPAPAGTACDDGLCPANTQCDGAGTCGNPNECAPESDCTLERFRTVPYWFCERDKTWTDARARCQAVGMDLVHIESAEENDFVESTMDETSFIGATDTAVEGEWRWALTQQHFWQGDENNGAPVGGAYNNWDDDHPDARSADEEDCAEINRFSGDWNTEGCASDREAYVCERVAPEPFVTCVSRVGASGNAALFGYRNHGPAHTIAEGASNSLAPSTVSAPLGIVENFEPGLVPDAMWVPFDGPEVSWTLMGLRAVATPSSPGCPPSVYGAVAPKPTPDPREPDPEGPSVPDPAVADRVVPDVFGGTLVPAGALRATTSASTTGGIGTVQQALTLTELPFTVRLTKLFPGTVGIGGCDEPEVNAKIEINGAESSRTKLASCRDIVVDGACCSFGCAACSVDIEVDVFKEFSAPVSLDADTVEVHVDLDEVDNVSGDENLISATFSVDNQTGQILDSTIVDNVIRQRGWGVKVEIEHTGIPDLSTQPPPRICAKWNAAFVDEGNEGVTGEAVGSGEAKRYPAAFAAYRLRVNGPIGEFAAGTEFDTNGNIVGEPEFLDGFGCVPDGVIGTDIPTEALVLLEEASDPGNPDTGGVAIELTSWSLLTRQSDAVTYEVFECVRDPSTEVLVDIDGDGTFCEAFSAVSPSPGNQLEAAILGLDNTTIDTADWVPTSSVWSAPPAVIDVTSAEHTPATRVSAIASQILRTPDVSLAPGETFQVFASRPCGGARTPEDSCASTTARIGPGSTVLDSAGAAVPCADDADCGSPFQTCSRNFTTLAPICRWLDDSRWKYVVAHELGHQYQRFTFGFFGTEVASTDAYVFPCPQGDVTCALSGTLQTAGPNAGGDVRLLDPFLVDPLCRCDHVEIANRHHCAQSVERSGDAQTEGFGHFFAAMVWNRSDTAQPFFQYYKEFLDQDCRSLSGTCDVFSGLARSQPPVPFNPYDAEQWRDRNCPMQPAGVPAEELQDLQTFGVEIDWHGFYYSLVRAPNPSERLGMPTFHDIYRAACSSVVNQGAIVLPSSGLRNCRSDAVAWTDAIVNPVQGITDGLSAGVRDSAERLFEMDGLLTAQEQALLLRVEDFGTEYGVDTNTMVAP